MEKKKHNQTLGFKASKKKLSAEGDCYRKTVLKRVLSHLSKAKSKKKSSARKNCPAEDTSGRRADRQVKLKCRQLPNVVQELRKALMVQDWNYVATLAMILCHPGQKYYTTIILRVCLILLLSHPKSNFKLLENFIRLTTGYVLEEDINKFIRILLLLRNRTKPLEHEKHIRKTSDYKVVRDPEFENI